MYFSFLFSCAYYGIARVSGNPYSWPNAFVTAVFIPFLITDLPKILSLKLLGGIQCVLIVTIGFGTIFNFLNRKLSVINKAACDLSDRLADQRIHEKYLILEEKFSTPPSAHSNK